MIALPESVVAAATAAILEPLARELARYLTGEDDGLPEFVHALPVPLRSRVAVEAAKKRGELLKGNAE